MVNNMYFREWTLVRYVHMFSQCSTVNCDFTVTSLNIIHTKIFVSQLLFAFFYNYYNPNPGIFNISAGIAYLQEKIIGFKDEFCFRRKPLLTNLDFAFNSLSIGMVICDV